MDGLQIYSSHTGQTTALRLAETPIGGKDLWIACHALVLGAALVTHNLREFSQISGLLVVDWADER